MQDGWEEAIPIHLSTAFVDHPCPRFHRFVYVILHVAHLPHFGQRRYVCIFERASPLQCIRRSRKSAEEFIPHILVHVDDFQRCTALAVETPSALDAFLDGQVNVRIWKNYSWVFRFQPKHLPHAVGLRVLADERIARLAVANQSEHVDVAGLHNR